MNYKPFSVVYNCDDCTDELRKTRGCKRNIKKMQLRIDCTCGGIAGCDTCARPLQKGKRKLVSWGWFTINRCPAAFCKDLIISRFLPYYWHWKGTDYMKYPDDRGRIYQPSILLEAFSICNCIAIKREVQEMENAKNLKK
jgi:hypothetical protein